MKPLSLGCCKSDVKIEEIYDCYAFFKDHDLKITAFQLHALKLSSYLSVNVFIHCANIFLAFFSLATISTGFFSVIPQYGNTVLQAIRKYSNKFLLISLCYV